MPEALDHEPPDPEGGVPIPLRVAGVLVVVEGLVLVVLGLTEVVSLDRGRLTMGLTVTVFFWAFGVLLVVCGWALTQLRPLARGPALLAQLIGLGLAWNFRDGSTLPVAIAMAVVAVLVLGCLVHPRSVEALDGASEQP